LFQRGPGAPYHGPYATKADLGNELKRHLADNVRKPAVFGKIALIENRSKPHRPLGNSKPISR
jgi:hypothetical protein